MSDRLSENQEQFSREDNIAYCPRQDKTVLVLGPVCFYKKRDQVCSGCVFDSERTRINVRLIWIMSEILQESSLEKKADVPRQRTRETEAVQRQEGEGFT